MYFFYLILLLIIFKVMEKLTNEISRYSKQSILPQIGIDGQKKLSNAKVIVIGAGGIGCPVLSYLTSAGIGTIGVFDFDTVEISNLHRQVLYDESQIGIKKTEAAVNKLQKLNSDTSFNFHDCYLNSKNGFEILNGYDVIVDATDNFKSRYLINDICINLSKPFVMGAINKFEGQVAVLNHNNGPTYRCIYPDIPGKDSISNCEESGVIGSLCGIVGTITATEVIKLITGAGNMITGEILYINSLTMEFSKIKVKRNSSAVDEIIKLKNKILI